MLSHVPEPQQVLAEAFRVLRPGGQIALFDGDYNTLTVATSGADPLQSCAKAVIANYVNDPWIIRRASAMLTAARFTGPQLRSHGYVQTTGPTYLLSVVDRGADALAADSTGPRLAAALKAEARRRAEAGSFFGYAYASLTACKPQ